MKTLILGIAFTLATAISAAAAATIEREFHYAAGSFSTRWHADTLEVGLAGATPEAVAGRPDLPVVAERLDLPPGLRVRSVSVVGARAEPLAGSARVRSVGTSGPTESSPLVEIGQQGTMRGRNLAWLLVRPVRWDAATGRLERLASLRTRIELEPDAGADVVRRERIVPEWEDEAEAASSSLASIPKKGATPFKPEQIPSVLGSPVAYVIVTSDALAPEFQRLADWKTQSGVPAVVRTLSFIRQQYAGADDADRIRRFLRDAYARWGAKWALLGGDTDVIPTRVAWTRFYAFPGEMNDIPTDLYFSCLDGNWNADGDALYGEGDSTQTIPRDACDLLPEIWVGRAAVSTLPEAAQFVDKVLQYSRAPAGDYERSVLFFAEVLDPQDWTPGDFIYLDGAAIAEECLPYLRSNSSMRYARLYENHLDTLWEAGALQETKRAVRDSLNAGYNLAVHSGHGFRNVMSVGDSNLTNADAMALTNGNRLTNFYTVNCTSNAIDFPCIGEALMKAPGGGAVSNIGSTRLDFPSTGRAYQKEFFRLVFRDSVSAVGEAQGRQKLLFVPSCKFDNTHRWTQMTLLLLGDPEMRIWTGAPRALAVSHAASMEADDTTLAVHVAIGAQPLAGARVTAFKAGDDYQSALTDAAGNVTLDFRPDGAGALSLVVTGYDCVPYRTTVPVALAPGPLLVENAPVLDDDSAGGTSGNGDGLLDAGETVAVTIPVKNNGAGSVSSVVGTLACTHPAVAVLNGSVSYGTVNPGATSSGTGSFLIGVAASAADQTEIPLTLTLFDGAGRRFVESLRLVLRAPDLRHFRHVVTEVVGDGDGRPEPGETVQYVAEVQNLGTGAATGVQAILRRLDALTTVTDSTTSFGDVAAGAAKQGDAFAFTVHGAAARLELRITTSRGLLRVDSLDLGYPAPPSGLVGQGFAKDVQLSWQPNVEADLLGYNVYRRPTSAGGPFTRINAYPADSVSYYLDSGLSPLTRYDYQVSAVDRSGNESAVSALVSVSTTPPAHAIFPIPMGGTSPSSMAVARIYQAGKMDILAGAEGGLYCWHENGTAPVDADQSPLTSGDFTTLGSGYSAGASVADLDGGGLEIVAPTWNDMSLYVFDTQGQVKPGWPFMAASPIWSLAAIGDLNRDGSKEIVFGSNGDKLYALRASGAEWRDGDADPATPGVFKVLGSIYNYGTPALADLDGDGQLEIVYSGFDGMLYAWRHDGSNLPGFPIALGGPSNSSVAIGRLDGPADTSPEIVATSGGSDDSLYVFSANGARRPGFPVRLVTSGGYGKQPSPALADMDGDGKLDIVVAATDGRIFVYDRNGVLDPDFADVRFSTLGAAATESSPVVADIDGDGYPDIVIGDDMGTLSAFDRSGRLLPGFPITVGGEVKGTPALCDCDGDGLSEIALAGWDGSVYVWDYDFPFSPGVAPPWAQFHHDAARTGLASAETLLGLPLGSPPRALRLAPPFPNPAQGAVRFRYDVPSAAAGSRLSLQIFDLAGRAISTLAQGRAEAGEFAVSWNLRGGGGPVPPGVYLALLEVGSERASHRLVVLP